MRLCFPSLFPLCAAAAFAATAVTESMAGEERAPREAPAAVAPAPAAAAVPDEARPAVEKPPLSLSAAADRLAESDAKVMELESRLRSLGESLAASNRDSEAMREEYERLRLQLETLGIAALKPEVRTLQVRLISALNDYRLADLDKKALSERLAALSDAALALLSDPTDSNGRKRLQEELAAANSGLQSAARNHQNSPVALDAAKVISLKSDLGLAVINTGRDSGLRSGAPMRIVRGDQTVATGLVVDVRNRIAGILVTSAAGRGQIQVGDSAKPETTLTNLQK
ncbi:MAG: hypothetical protein EOP86_02450 [Verrucomicrobiaceae bacterium]|nr:MAG: hypothetical protein EOP86_02450 [Verrucomicrobiaceae bacterium]